MSERVFELDGLDQLAAETFPGLVVRKDLLRRMRTAFGVPAFVIEYLLGKYCASTDEQAIQEGLEFVRETLSSKYVKPNEREAVKSAIKQHSTYEVIDKISVRLPNALFGHEHGVAAEAGSRLQDGWADRRRGGGRQGPDRCLFPEQSPADWNLHVDAHLRIPEQSPADWNLHVDAHLRSPNRSWPYGANLCSGRRRGRGGDGKVRIDLGDIGASGMSWADQFGGGRDDYRASGDQQYRQLLSVWLLL